MQRKNAWVAKSFSESAANLGALAANEKLITDLIQASSTIAEAYTKGGCLFVIGNGGSAADAQHLVAELISKLSKDRDPIKAFALTVDTSILTAIGNDYGYEKVFSRQVRGVMNKNDILLAITTSGNSPNILEALKACKEIGAHSILLSGRDGGKATHLADQALLAPGAHTAAIQEAHLVMYHMLCALIESDLAEKGLVKFT